LDITENKQGIKLFIIIALVMLTALAVRISAVTYIYTATAQDNKSYPRFFVEQDSSGYFKIADNLNENGEYNSFSRPPLYPLVISLVGKLTDWDFTNLDRDLGENDYAREVFKLKSARILILINHLMGLGKIFLIMLIVWNVCPSRRAVALAGILGVLDPFNFYSDNTVLPYCMGQFFTLLAYYFYLTWLKIFKIRWIVSSGISLCLATLAIPAFMFVWAFIAIHLLFCAKTGFKVRVTAVLIMVVFANLLPFLWSVRNYNLTGVFVYSSIQLRQFHNPIQNYVMANKEKISLTEANRISEIPVKEMVAKTEIQLGRKLNELEIFEIDKELAVKYLIENFSWWVTTHIKGVLSYFTKWYSIDSAQQRVGSGIFVFYKAGNLFCAFAILIAVTALCISIQSGNLSPAILLGLPFLFFLNTASPHNAPRYIGNWLVYAEIIIGVFIGFIITRKKLLNYIL
jgi:hypothetical protein